MKSKYFSVIFALVLLLTACQQHTVKYNNLEELSGEKTFAIPEGSAADDYTLAKFPDAKIIYYKSTQDCCLAVKAGKADAAAYDDPILKNIIAGISGLKLLDDLIADYDFAYAVRLGNKVLKSEADDLIKEMKSNGVYDEMLTRWFPEAGECGPMPEIETTGENGKLVFGTAAVTVPFSYTDPKNNIIGFDIEFAARLAQKLGKKLVIKNMDFGKMIPSLTSAKVDMIGACITITEDRLDKVLFTDPIYNGGLGVVVKE